MTTSNDNEVARLRKYVELIEIFSPENEWSLPQWRRLIGSKEENEDPETLFNLYQFRIFTEPKETITEKDTKVSVNEFAQENEVERLKEMVMEAARRGDEMVTQARKAHFETCKNAQSAIEKLHTENICLQELIQEFYEWSRRDYPTEAEVREIMDRYYDLLNKGLPPNNKNSHSTFNNK